MGKIDNPHKPPLDQIKKAQKRIRSTGIIPSVARPSMQQRIAAIRAKRRRRIFV